MLTSRFGMCFVFLLLVVAFSLLRCGGAKPPPNVLLLVVDTLRADRLGVYGWPEPTSPNIDRLAASGVLFEAMHAQAPQTQPSFSSILTGAYPMSHGVRANGIFSLDPEVLTLAEILRDHGYRTGAVVAGFPLDSRFGLGQGFEIYYDEMKAPSKGPRRWNGHTMQSFESDAPQVTSEAIRLLREVKGGPFFLMVHYFDPHHDYRPPATLGRRFSHPYLGEVATVDQQIGPLLAELDRLGNAGNTLVVFTADHGEALGEQGRFAHQQHITHATIHVPFILRLPGVLPSGVRIPGVCRSVDVLPTILDLLEIPVPASVEGRSLLPAIEKGETGVDFAYFETLWGKLESKQGTTRQGISDGKWKLIRQVRAEPDESGVSTEVELYHLASDPEETRNLLTDQPERAAELELRLEEFLDEHPERRAGVLSPDPDVIRRLKALGYL